MDMLTFTINLLITLSIAMAGFIVGNLDKDVFRQARFFGGPGLARTVLVIVGLSVTFGVATAIGRWFDYRYSRQKNAVWRTRAMVRLRLVTNDTVEGTFERFKIIKRKSQRARHVIHVCFRIQLVLFLIALWSIILFV